MNFKLSKKPVATFIGPNLDLRVPLYRIKATRAIHIPNLELEFGETKYVVDGYSVKRGEIGGLVSKEVTLPIFEPDWAYPGNGKTDDYPFWICQGATVFGSTTIFRDTLVLPGAVVGSTDGPIEIHRSVIGGGAMIQGYSGVYGSRVDSSTIVGDKDSVPTNMLEPPENRPKFATVITGSVVGGSDIRNSFVSGSWLEDVQLHGNVSARDSCIVGSSLSGLDVDCSSLINFSYACAEEGYEKGKIRGVHIVLSEEPS